MDQCNCIYDRTWRKFRIGLSVILCVPLGLIRLIFIILVGIFGWLTVNLTEFLNFLTDTHVYLLNVISGDK
jgi:hypothetical protein